MASLRVEAIRSEHRIKMNALYGQSGVLQYKQIIFYVLAYFFYTFIGQYGPEFLAKWFYAEMLPAERCLYRQIICRIRLP